MGRTQDDRWDNIRAEAESDPRGLPMPPTPRPSLDEWREYRGRREFQLARSPDYDDYWRRPTPETAEAVWQLVAPALRLRIADFMPQASILDRATAAERAAWRAEVELTTKQALVVTLNYAVQLGRKRYYTRRDEITGERKARRALVTKTGLFDQLAERWSDNYRVQRKQCPGIRVRDFTPDTARACWDDLRRNGIDLEQFWHSLVKRRFNPLFRAAWRKNKSGRRKGGRGRGHMVELKPGKALDTFERLLRQDPGYKTPDGRLLLADEQTPELRVRQKYAGGRPYDVVNLGDRSRKLIETMSETRLLFNATSFREDTQRLLARIRGLSGEERETAEAWLASMLPVEAQLREGSLPAWTHPQSGETVSELVLVKSGFERLMNRRYQPKHFWPPEARTEKEWPEPEPERTPAPAPRSEDYGVRLWRPLLMSARARWWAAEGLDADASREREIEPREDMEVLGVNDLVGVDVSSSGTQILAVLLGLDELEALASSTTLPFKRFLAELAWRKQKDPADSFSLPARYTGPEDADLIEDVKTFWMRVIYGANPRTPGNGSRRTDATFKNLPDGWTVQNGVAFLEAVPQYAAVRQYFEACKKIGRTIAHPQHPDRYRGVVFTDPYDGAEVRWNPVDRVDQVVSRDGVKLILSVPGHFDKNSKRAVPNDPDPVTGDYPVRRGGKRGLTLRVAPCLVHMLDAFYASLVIEQLVAQGVRDFVSIHDGWLVPEYVRDLSRPGYWLGGSAVLEKCLVAAGREWLQELGVVYARLLHYLGSDPKYGAAVRGWQARWEARVAAQGWPVFAAKEVELQAYGPFPAHVAAWLAEN